MKVLVSDKLSDQGVKILKDAGLTVDVNTKLTPEELLKVIPDYEGLVVRSGTKVTREVLAAAAKLKVVGRAGSGLDNVDLEEATRRGVVVMNTPGGNTITTAEHTIALMLSMVRLIPQATASTKAGKWEKNRFTGMELYNKVLGVVGMGQIGGHVAKLAQGLLMRVIAYDPFLAELEMTAVGVEPVTSLMELCQRADFLSMHAPLNAETRHMMGEREFRAMKKSAIFINNGRGPTVNEAALADALRQGWIAGAALDVFEVEPVDPNNALLHMDNVLVSPHIASATARMAPETRRRLGRELATVLQGKWPRSAVNPGVLPKTSLIRWQPYPMGRGPNR